MSQIYKLSQESHQVFRRCKGSVPAAQLTPPPPNYARPSGLKVIPAMLDHIAQSPVSLFEFFSRLIESIEFKFFSFKKGGLKPAIQVSKLNNLNQPSQR